ncbi:transposase [Cellulomonas sp. P24]|nr:transposase [Cellulomonas sp. P24]
MPISECEPAGHGIGRSRGGLTTKIHAAVDEHGRPLAAVVTGAHRNDGALLDAVLADIRVPRLGAGRPRTRPDTVLADKAYSAGVYRRALHARGIKVVIPARSPTRSPPANAAGPAAGAHPDSTPPPTATATSSRAASGPPWTREPLVSAARRRPDTPPVACAGGVRTSAPGAGELNARSAS